MLGHPPTVLEQTSMRDDNTDDKERIDWESISRDLLDQKLEVRAEKIRASLTEIARDMRADEDPDPADLTEAREHLDLATQLIEGHLGPARGGTIRTQYDDAER